MHLYSALLLALVVVMCSAKHRDGHRSSSCTYWCKTRTNRFYCCDDNPGPIPPHFDTRPPHHSRPELDTHHTHHTHHTRPVRPGRPLLKPVDKPSFGGLPSAGGHRGQCPPVRHSCPRTAHKLSGPRTCHDDFSCGHADKCCYDVCLQLKVCKPAH